MKFPHCVKFTHIREVAASCKTSVKVGLLVANVPPTMYGNVLKVFNGSGTI